MALPASAPAAGPVSEMTLTLLRMSRVMGALSGVPARPVFTMANTLTVSPAWA